MTRKEQIQKLQKEILERYDIIIIGGGATGLGTALDAITRGYKTLLLEKSDFASGTSSRSTKLVHGGVRYLAQMDIMLVVEALRERGLMLKNAPHLTRNQEFIIPVYNWFDAFFYTAGLKFYDILSGKLSLGKSYFINRKKVVERLPNIKQEGLKGGIVYHDGQFDDSRMAIALAKACAGFGGTVLNYFEVTGLIKDESGKVRGVKATDRITGSEYEINSSLVINATGVFADDILRMDRPEAQRIIKPSQGVHVVLEGTFLQGDSALMIPKTEDGRVLFAIPWYDRTVAGTTDTPLDTICEEPVALREEIDFILRTAGKYMAKTPEKKNILSVFAGLRPLASDPDNPHATKEISRRHKIILSPSGLLSITGGKWTTYRCMAEETIDMAIKNGILKKRKCLTKTLKIGSSPENISSGRLKIYGESAAEIESMMKENPQTAEKISDALPYTKAEVIWICRNEMPVTLEDMLSRRTRAMIFDALEAEKCASVVAEIMAKELGYDEKWIDEQVTGFRKSVKNYLPNS
ncbi:MAG: glycerol-3-phosphate dehydrogenase/oxidase [Bacteroidales bacterium]